MEDDRNRIEVGAGNQKMLQAAHRRFVAEVGQVATIVGNVHGINAADGWEFTPDFSALVKVSKPKE